MKSFFSLVVFMKNIVNGILLNDGVRQLHAAGVYVTETGCYVTDTGWCEMLQRLFARGL